MNCYLLKLKFSAPVHFGDGENAQSLSGCDIGCRADTFFSALCHAALSAGGEARLLALADQVRADKLRFSDLFPYAGDRLYLPKPMLPPAIRGDANSLTRKRMKKLTRVACRDMEAYMAYLHGGDAFEAEMPSLGVFETADKAKIHADDDAEPYSVEAFRFSEENECGLYVLFSYDDEAWKDEIVRLVKLCGLSGLGGKLSAGYGKFSLDDEFYLDEGFDEDTDYLVRALKVENYGRYMLLTTSLPGESEMEAALNGADYGVARRAGFAQSGGESFRKKRTQYFLTAGSVVNYRFSGELYTVGDDAHPALRYGKPLYLGVPE